MLIFGIIQLLQHTEMDMNHLHVAFLEYIELTKKNIVDLWQYSTITAQKNENDFL